MGGRGSGGGRGGGGGAASKIHDKNTQDLMKQLGNNLQNINQKLKENPSFEKERQLKIAAREIKEQMKYYKKTDKIKFINEYGGSDIQDWESYSSKDIDNMFRQVQKGKKLKKLGYTWVVDYES